MSVYAKVLVITFNEVSYLALVAVLLKLHEYTH